MARTAAHRTTDPGTTRPWRSSVVHTLRRTRAEQRAAAREGRRARPQPVTRQVAVYALERMNRDASVRTAAAHLERRARQALRRRLGELARYGADAVEVEPARHRHSVLWRS
ncbi:hypothetical protein [Kitasatospora sp. NPDC059571]|uniref:hypothetical protein n=1 Tax=Kitasatospora sp. NPDC059571 TaxID=3346871 RepID=UPI0036B38B8C